MSTQLDPITLLGQGFRLIDLSNRVSNATTEFEPNKHSIQYIDHAQSVEGGDASGWIPRYLWEGGPGLGLEIATLSTHSGTHVDAPWHYGPEVAGEPARTIDQMPLSWFIGSGVVLDFSSLPAGSSITRDDVESELARIGYTLQAGDIVLIRTDASKHFDAPGYEERHSGLRRTATEFLVDQGVRVIGIDAWGLDRPFSSMKPEAEAGDTGQWLESHRFGREREYCQIEKLCNLDQIPVAYGFLVIALPVKLADAGAGWTRAIALVPS